MENITARWIRWCKLECCVHMCVFSTYMCTGMAGLLLEMLLHKTELFWGVYLTVCLCAFVRVCVGEKRWIT